MALPAPTVLTPTALPGGLLASASDLSAGWENGIEFTPATCLVPERVAVCPEDYTGELDEVGPVQFMPIELRQGVKCSSLSRLDVGRLAGETIDITTEYLLAQELQDGAASGNPALVDATSLGTSTVVGEAISWLEEAGAAALAGRLIVIHVPALLSVYLPDTIYRDGEGNWRTRLGSLVVISPGYTGSDIYATGEVYAAVSPIDTKERMERSTNIDEGWGERFGLVAFDPCFNVSVTTPIDGPPSP